MAVRKQSQRRTGRARKTRAGTGKSASAAKPVSVKTRALRPKATRTRPKAVRSSAARSSAARKPTAVRKPTKPAATRAKRAPAAAAAAASTSTAAAPAAVAGLLLVNVIPRAQSGEEHQDSEPSLAVNPTNPLQMAISAFTPDPNGTDQAPIFVSIDGGQTWLLNSIIPSVEPSGAQTDTGTGDITLRFSANQTLYAGILRLPGDLRLNVLRTKDFMGAAPMEVLLDRDGQRIDQPFVQATTLVDGPAKGKDALYVGSNNLDAAAGRSASIDLSLDAGAAAPIFSTTVLETRDPDTGGVDSPAIRPALHADGTVYVAFLHRLSVGQSADGFSLRRYDVVVVRDDQRGAGASPFTALTDPGDQHAGVRVAQNRLIPWLVPGLGQERTGSDLAIAVDPADSGHVFIAWADRIGQTDYTLHVRRSTDRGKTWSAADLRTIPDAKNPALAITERGRLGFLYQQLAGSGAAQRWVTHLQTSDDGVNWNDLILAQVPAGSPQAAFFPYLGDYVSLTAAGPDLYGVFCASNAPDRGNFPNGVVYQRNVDWAGQHLLDVDGSAIQPSIDPFFFRLTA